jgi:hypothetical protein
MLPAGLTGTVRTGGPATRGYRLVRRKPYRNWLLHRAVADVLVKEFNPFGWESLPPDKIFHHLSGLRGCCCPHNLVILDHALHVHPSVLRHPWTGQYMSVSAWQSLMGE